MVDVIGASLTAGRWPIARQNQYRPLLVRGTRLRVPATRRRPPTCGTPPPAAAWRERGFHAACADLDPERRFVVYPGTERFPLDDVMDAIGVVAMAKELLSVR